MVNVLRIQLIRKSKPFPCALKWHSESLNVEYGYYFLFVYLFNREWKQRKCTGVQKYAFWQFALQSLLSPLPTFLGTFSPTVYEAKKHSCTASNIMDILYSILNQHEKSTCSKMNKHLRKHKQNLFTSEWRDLWWPSPSDKTLLIHITKKWPRCIRKAEVELCDEDGMHYCFRSKEACHY